ncbi:hypothetical protein DL98DRAFT_530860 [Cadophora sp. DSE1049]|nr:hypothetical protein DL98DRAFT_530860 [Cadophora sp. DSE1049]
MAPKTAENSFDEDVNKGYSREYMDSEAHPRIEDDLPDAIQGKYCGKFLAKTLRENAKTDITTRLGDSEMRILGLPIPPIETEAQAKAMVLRFFPIFDRAFFINRVGEIAQGPVELYDDIEDTGKFCYSGDRMIRLNMSIPDRKCPLGEKPLNCKKRTARTGGPGKTNHGFTFCNAMIGLQEALQREVKWKVDCDLAHSVYAEMEASAWESTDEQLKRWGLEDVISQIRRGKRSRARAAVDGQSRSSEPGGAWDRKELKRACCTMM